MATTLALALAACATSDDSYVARPTSAPRLARVATAAETAAWDISIPPSGEGLPAGRGTVKEGEAVYATHCQACHGAKGEGKPADRLVGGVGSLKSAAPVRTVGSYWPYATTLFDYTRRAMPLTRPMSLTNDQVYAVTAYLLYLNGIVDEGAALDARTLPLVRMPNAGGFIDASRQ
ncbi:MAG TPA: cytochrome c [Burkholderiales bacterium]|nr:cytochrome c [Burkholderiales bacterium]